MPNIPKECRQPAAKRRVVCIPGLDEAAATGAGGRRTWSYAESVGADRRCGSRVSRRRKGERVGGRVGDANPRSVLPEGGRKAMA